MDFIQTKIEKIRLFLAKKNLDDPRLLGLVLLAVIGLSVVWSGTKVVQQNYELVGRIAVLEEENRILELENRNMEIQIEYYKTPEFAELKARKVNGKAAKGETVYIVTNETALTNLQSPQDNESEDTIAQKPEYQRNFESWIDFFFGS
jgi:cell division protein FtsB